MFVFLCLGYFMKLKNVFEKASRIVYIFSFFVFMTVIFMSLIFLNEMPYVTHKICIHGYIDIILYVLLGTTGTISIVALAKCFSNVLLSYIGRNTMVIYCIHITILTVVEYFVAHHIASPSSWLGTILFYSVVLFITTSIYIGSVFAINSKSLRWILMK